MDITTVPTLAPPPGYVSPDALKLQQDYAKALLSQSQSDPVHSWSQGLGNMVEALVGGSMARKAGERQTAAESAAMGQSADLITALMNPAGAAASPGGGGGTPTPAPAEPPSDWMAQGLDAATPSAALAPTVIDPARVRAVLVNPYIPAETKSQILALWKTQMPKPDVPFNLSPGQHHFVNGRDVASLPAADKSDQSFTLGAGQTRFDKSGKPIASVPKVAAGAWRPATPDEKAQYGVPEGTPLMFGPDGKPRVLGNGSGGATANPDDVKNIAQAIINGDQPPVLTGLYRLGGPVRSELEKQGYNLTDASQDWTATQRLLATMNGTQQTRLRQAVGQVKEGLPLLRDLAEQWNAGGFPVLNAANRALAESGSLGPEAQKIVVNLKSGIADITSEMGNVLMGGNSPTDHALELAGQNLNVDWSYPTFVSALEQMQKLIGYRENALKLGTAGIANSKYNDMQAPVVAPITGPAPAPAAAPAVAPAAAAPSFPTPTPQAIDALKAHPELKDQFIQKYGPNAMPVQ